MLKGPPLKRTTSPPRPLPLPPPPPPGGVVVVVVNRSGSMWVWVPGSGRGRGSWAGQSAVPPSGTLTTLNPNPNIGHFGLYRGEPCGLAANGQRIRDLRPWFTHPPLCAGILTAVLGRTDCPLVLQSVRPDVGPLLTNQRSPHGPLVNRFDSNRLWHSRQGK